ncbi:expressed unknown protein [Seminavis robusta]|uniref:Major facilitator superfamily associated domain-containing protein n=1 Tax=Seminavis robusta TaxID=568900 RepID=A0A9N8HHK8_9STRA|nr:expressed unknown protein [Seminavis robusta]|eukprot:Sro568_g168120.1 n/a (488) ;mRNA; r:17672-19135
MTTPSSTYRPRILYLSLFSWMSVSGGRFLAPFLKEEAELSDSWIGTTFACQYAILSLLAPWFGHWADQREKRYPHKGRAQILMATVTIGTLSFSLHGLHYVVPLPVFHSLPFHILAQCGYATAFASLFPILDGMTVDYLDRLEGSSSSDYGAERLYGAVSWGVANLLFGVLLDKFGMFIYFPCAWAAALYSIVSIMLFSSSSAAAAAAVKNDSESNNHPSEATALLEAATTNGHQNHHQQPNDNTTDQKEDTPSTLALMGIIFGSVYGTFFLFCYFVLNTGFSVVENLVFLFFEFLGASHTLEGITVALTVVFEIPVFSLAPVLLKRHGVGLFLVMANVAYLIRVIGYTLIPQGHSWLVFLVEPLHGFTYAGAQASAVEFVNQHVPRGSEASGQGIVNFVRGLASVLGLISGGWLQEHCGPRFMYRVFIVCVAVGTASFVSVRCIPRYQAEENVQRDTPVGEAATNVETRQHKNGGVAQDETSSGAA